MHDHIAKYHAKLIRDRTAAPDSIRFYVLDEGVLTNREDAWLPVFEEVLAGLDVTALLFARTSHPFPDFLVERTDPGSDRLVPNDSETRVFLHDIPFIRTTDWFERPLNVLAEKIIFHLGKRKAVIIQGLGIVAAGGVTVEQAFIAFSSIYHTTFVKYLLDVLKEGFYSSGEKRYFEEFKKAVNMRPPLDDLLFTPGPLPPPEVYSEIVRVGRYTVEKGYVDSFFGNISYFDGSTIFISQTTSSLDELQGYIDPVPVDGSSTAGLSASSELPAHRGIYASTGFRAVLHGHPRFSVIMSMYCLEEDCSIPDCNRLCDRKRSVCGAPVVAGETGAGGLARSVPPAMSGGVCLVYGHGTFAAGETGFRKAFFRMADLEDECRIEYFRLAEQRK